MSTNRILILGGSSKVWRLMRPYWFDVSKRYETIVAARQLGDGVDLTLRQVTADPPAVDFVFSFLGVTNERDDSFDRNAELAAKASGIAKKAGARLVIQMSSGAVYPPSPCAHFETSMASPLTHYGRSKRAAELKVIGHRPQALCLRLGNVAGADSLYQAMAKDAPVTLDCWEDSLSPQRSFIAPDDLARICQWIAEQDAGALPAVLNVAGPKPVFMADIVAQKRIGFVFRPAPVAAIRRHILDVSQLSALGLEMPTSSDASHLANFDWPEAQVT